MKRFAILMLCVLALSLVTVPVMAAGTQNMSVAVSGAKASPGDLVTVTVSVSTVENCTGGGFLFSYDKNVFEYVDGAALPGVTGFHAGVSNAAGNVAGYFMNGNGTVQGGIFRIRLKVKETADYGTYTITGIPSLTKGEGAVSCAAGSASVTVSCDHSFGNWGDAGNGEHSRTCSLCGAVEYGYHRLQGTVTGKATCKQEGTVEYICQTCGYTARETLPKTSAHTYDHGCDGACNVCGATRNTTHQYKNTLSADKTTHWLECIACKEKKDIAPHTPGQEATETTAQRCTACGYILKPALGHSHQYAAQWTTDDSGHWFACMGCEEKKDFTSHDFETPCDTSCSLCPYTRNVTHGFEKQWVGETLWNVCAGCGEKEQLPVAPGETPADPNPETGGEGEGSEASPKETAETAPMETETLQPEEEAKKERALQWEKLWWIPVVLITATAVCLVVLRKKKTV